MSKNGTSSSQQRATAFHDPKGLPPRLKFTYNGALFVIAALLFVVFGIFDATFFTYSYILETVKMVIEIAIMALPITLIIISGGIDFSMSSILVLSAVCGGVAARWTNPWIGIAVALLVGILCGIFNGALIAKLKLPPLVTTLATMYLFKGMAEGMTLGLPSVGASVSGTVITNYFGTGNFLGFPAQIWVYIILGIVFHLLLAKTYFGRSLYAIGLNENGARFSGINIAAVKIMMYGLGGLIFAIAGVVFIGRFSVVKFDSADLLTLQVITAVVLGGTNIAGGSGNIKGTVLGVAIIGILKGGLNVLFVPQTQQKIILGIILLLSLVIFAVIEGIGKRNAPLDNAAAVPET